MTALFVLVGKRSGEALTYGGRVITHENRAEMAWLFPNERVAEYRPGNDLTMRLVDHPDMAVVRFPLNRKDFRRER